MDNFENATNELNYDFAHAFFAMNLHSFYTFFVAIFYAVFLCPILIVYFLHAGVFR